MSNIVQSDLTPLTMMPIYNNAQDMLLDETKQHHKKLMLYIKNCGTEFNMEYLSYKPNGVQSCEFQFHRLHEVTGDIITKRFPFCQYCGDYLDNKYLYDADIDIKGGNSSNTCYDIYCRTRKYKCVTCYTPSNKLLLKFLKMNLDENHQNTEFRINNINSRPGHRFITIE
jgi:hypothetical protein